MLRPNIGDVGSQRAHIGVTNQVLTVLALRHVGVPTERAHEGHDIHQQLVRNARGESECLLDTLVAVCGSVDRSAVRSKKLRKAKAEISNTNQSRESALDQGTDTNNTYGGFA